MEIQKTILWELTTEQQHSESGKQNPNSGRYREPTITTAIGGRRTQAPQGEMRTQVDRQCPSQIENSGCPTENSPEWFPDWIRLEVHLGVCQVLPPVDLHLQADSLSPLGQHSTCNNLNIIGQGLRNQPLPISPDHGGGTTAIFRHHVRCH